ncbi:MAG: hypothetical protein NZL87_00035, partial [Thermomicrobium sp.]|nr:hypothetical protein [Thermomicrobium sp.]
ILRVLGVIPVIGGLVGFVVWIWILVATVIAIRHACDFSTGRAIATAVVSSIVYFIFVVVPMTIMGALVGAVAS